MAETAIPKVLWHGTSESRWSEIQRLGLLRVGPSGHRCVSFTKSLSVAVYFANNRFEIDGSMPLILEVDAEALINSGFELEEFEDDFWGIGNCAWEEEVVCWESVPVMFAKMRMLPMPPIPKMPEHQFPT